MGTLLSNHKRIDYRKKTKDYKKENQEDRHQREDPFNLLTILITQKLL